MNPRVLILSSVVEGPLPAEVPISEVFTFAGQTRVSLAGLIHLAQLYAEKEPERAELFRVASNRVLERHAAALDRLGPDLPLEVDSAEVDFRLKNAILPFAHFETLCAEACLADLKKRIGFVPDFPALTYTVRFKEFRLVGLTYSFRPKEG